MEAEMTLSTVWFVIVAFFWTGFFVLEGFDFGVGALHKVVGRTDLERRVAINTIGPVWDGNEVWLVVAGACMFAAFPDWYASWFSALYLALWLLLAALIIRGVSFEFRGKFDRTSWRSTWSWTLTVGSVLAPLLFGIGLGDLLAGLPIDAAGDFTGTFPDLLTPYGLFFGITLLVLCLLHGSTFLSIRSTGVVLVRARAIARRLAIPGAVLVVAFAIWTYALARPAVWGILALAVPLAAVVIAAALVLGGRAGGRSFAATAVGIGGVIASLFANLYPNLMISSTDPANTLTVTNSTASSYSLQVMTIVAAVMVPLVLLYQGWTYYVFRRRVVGPAASDPTSVGAGR
jgi:cytochrome d ubiquinol oxidase subunit II